MPERKSPTPNQPSDSGQQGFDDPGAAERDSDLALPPKRGARERPDSPTSQDPDFDPVYDGKSAPQT